MNAESGLINAEGSLDPIVLQLERPSILHGEGIVAERILEMAHGIMTYALYPTISAVGFFPSKCFLLSWIVIEHPNQVLERKSHLGGFCRLGVLHHFGNESSAYLIANLLNNGTYWA